jgi:hypothetical protein
MLCDSKDETFLNNRGGYLVHRERTNYKCYEYVLRGISNFELYARSYGDFGGEK